MPPWRWAVPVPVVLLLATGTARAHEVGASRFDAPLPLPLLFAAAGLTVAVTAGWLAASGTRRPATDQTWQLLSLPPRAAGTLRTAARGLFFLAFLAALVDGVVGRQVRAENVATLFVWPVWLGGVGLVAMVFASPWRVFSPWRTIYRGLVRLEGDEIAVLGVYPGWLGGWPALAGFLAWFGVLANLTVLPRSPRATTGLLAGYAAIMVLGGVAYGPAWFRRADALAVLYRLFGRVAPLPIRRTDDGGLILTARPPWRACTEPVEDGVLAAFVVATVYTVSFDGFANTPEFQTVLFAAREVTGPGPVAVASLFLAGLLGFVVTFWAVAWLAERAAGSDDWRGAGLAVAPTLLPIAVAYEFAHGYPWVLSNLGQLATVVAGYVAASPPTVEPLWWLSLSAFWASQVALVVGGHIVAVIASHSVAVDRYEPPGADGPPGAVGRSETQESSDAGRYGMRGEVTRAHAPLTALMVAYTVLSLWIVSRPVVA